MGEISSGPPDLPHSTRLDGAEGLNCLRREGLHM
jgi:hypothetical protein